MRRGSLGGWLLVGALAACTPMKPVSPHPPAAGAGVVAVAPAVAVPQGAAPATNSEPAAAESAGHTIEVPAEISQPTQGAAASSDRPATVASAKSVAKSKSSAGSASAQPFQSIPAPRAVVAQAAAKPADAPAEKPSAPPALDLVALEQRLKDTRAIGVFTKLSLKNQVDDLLAQFRAYHRGDTRIPLANLRQRYDLLLIKVLSLLQDSDAPLAAAISSSREAIWSVLADPDQFAKI